MFYNFVLRMSVYVCRLSCSVCVSYGNEMGWLAPSVPKSTVSNDRVQIGKPFLLEVSGYLSACCGIPHILGYINMDKMVLNELNSFE